MNPLDQELYDMLQALRIVAAIVLGVPALLMFIIMFSEWIDNIKSGKYRKEWEIKHGKSSNIS